MIKNAFIVAVSIQSIGLICAMMFGRSFIWVQDVIYIPSWLIAIEGWLPIDILGEHKVSDNYLITTAVNLPILWLVIFLVMLAYRQLRKVLNRD